MNSTAKTNDVATLPSSPKAQTAKEVIAANVKLLIEQLEAGHSEGLTAYLTAMGRFHKLQLWQHSRNRTTEARRNPRCWNEYDGL
jgi:hypothetical protein